MLNYIFFDKVKKHVEFKEILIFHENFNVAYIFLNSPSIYSKICTKIRHPLSVKDKNQKIKNKFKEIKHFKSKIILEQQKL